MEDSELKLVRVATQEQLLGAGYVPEGRNLRGKDGSLLEASFLSSYAGKAMPARPTEAKEYPFTVDGHILPAAAVAVELGRLKLKGVEVVAFADGSLSIGNVHYTVAESAKLAGLLKI